MRLAEHEGIPIDPALSSLGVQQNPDAQDDEDIYDENPEANNAFRGKAPMMPQYVVPEGGILRDQDHAYETTEAITYDYPDPDAGIPIPVVVDEQEEEPSGYGPAEADSPGRIEMISRKRKRNKLEEGERAFYPKKGGKANGVGTPKKAIEQSKKRPSLIVRLPIDKDKLVEMDKMKNIAQQALNGVAPVPAPVIGSDLQALNTRYPTPEGQQPPNKKQRMEQLPMDIDEEFMPGRRRDRRKPRPDGVPLPPPDSDVTRRQTRMQAVTYEEAESEDEFNETVPEKPRQPLTSKLATMEQAADEDDESDEAEDMDDSDIDVPPQPQIETGKEPTPPAERSLSREVAQISPLVQSAARLTSSKSPETTTPLAPLRKPVPSSTITAYPRPISAPRPSTAFSAASVKLPGPSKLQAEAAANRRTKMALLNDDDSLDDWSDEETSAKPAPVVSNIPAPKLPTPAPAKPAAVTKPAAPAIRQSLPNLPQRSVNTPTAVLSRPPPKSVSVQKISATAADWDDSDSDDDDLPPVKRVTTGVTLGNSHSNGWASINGNGTNGSKAHVAGLKPAGVARKGRPL